MLFLKFMFVMGAICLLLAVCFAAVDFIEEQYHLELRIWRKTLGSMIFGTAITMILGIVVGLLYAAVKM